MAVRSSEISVPFCSVLLPGWCGVASLVLSLYWQATYHLQQSVYRCAMLWKQKALSKKLNMPCSFLPPLKKQVTCRMPDVRPETRGHSTDEEPWLSKCSYLPFHLADGDSVLSDL